MLVELAKNYYLGKIGSKRMNCAQSIIKAFEEQFKTEADLIERFSSYGRGKAPEGLCGAFYATKYLSENSSEDINFAEFEKRFIEQAGSIKCTEIKAARRLSCPDCIGKCAEFLQKRI
jgi:hypothetical protein